MRTRVFGILTALLLWALPASAATVRGIVTDTTGAALPDARVVVRDVASGREIEAQTGVDGRFEITTAGTGTFLVIAERAAFAEAAATITIDSDEATVEVPISLEIGSFASAVSVFAWPRMMVDSGSSGTGPSRS